MSSVRPVGKGCAANSRSFIFSFSVCAGVPEMFSQDMLQFVFILCIANNRLLRRSSHLYNMVICYSFSV